MPLRAFRRNSIAWRRAGLAGTLLLTVLGAGCGFHLQGESLLPAGVGHIQVTYSNDYKVGDPAFVTDLRERLRQQHLLGGSHAPAELHVVSVEDSEQTVAVSPIDGESVVEQLSVQVVFNYSVHGKNKLTGETLATSRDFTTDATQRLSSDDEQDHLLDQMQQDLVNRVLERVAHANAQNDHAVAADPASVMPLDAGKGSIN